MKSLMKILRALATPTFLGGAGGYLAFQYLWPQAGVKLGQYLAPTMGVGPASALIDLGGASIGVAAYLGMLGKGAWPKAIGAGVGIAGAVAVAADLGATDTIRAVLTGSTGQPAASAA